jgi:hypothetical protein
MVALPPPRLYLPAANWEGDLMPERGPVKLLLHFLHWRQAPGWKIGLAVALIAMLGLLPGEESLYQKAKTGLAQSLREAAWKHALGGEPESKPWPWDQASPAVYAGVPRLGLSAAVHCDANAAQPEQTFEPSRRPIAKDARDPHLAADTVEIGDGGANAVRVTGREVVVPHAADDQLLEPGAPPPVAASSNNCSPLDSAIPAAFRLMIEAIQARTNPTEIEQKL